mmetsp:Transcript_62264/g.139044  ORF Transcript_62264/g.139044 Transcript_62264/m.139044 type:complete len:470 (+) Transcript_62264:67-1476(+)
MASAGRFLTCTMLGLVSLAQGYEWAGIFETPENVYMWTAQKIVHGDHAEYVDPAMKLVVFSATTCDHEGLHSLEATATTAMAGTCPNVNSGGTVSPSGNACHRLVFDQSSWQTLFKVDATGVSCMAFFAEHVPTEFERTAHYLKDDEGTDIEPLDELPHAEPEPEETIPWGGAILTSVLVNLVTLVGVIMMVPGVKRMNDKYGAAFTAVVSGFAAGALLACAFFLLLFEATHLVAVGWTEEVEVLWRWGTMVLAGFALPPILDNILGFGESEQVAVEGEEVDKTPGSRTRLRLIGGVLLGDFFHNLCDGFFLGAGFKGCGVDFGWRMAIGTILHELPQEFADFVVLTGPEARLNPIIALFLNFLSGLSVLLGAIIILIADVSDEATGLLLCFGGGVYLHLGATDLMPKIYAKGLTKAQRAMAFFAFILGTVFIGLILIDHEHCYAGGEEGGHGATHGDSHGSTHADTHR